MISIPEHVCLSAPKTYPGLHEQTYEPGVFVHFWLHLFRVLDLHSSISIKDIVWEIRISEV